MVTHDQTRVITKGNKVIALDKKSMTQVYARYARAFFAGPSIKIRPHAGVGSLQKSVKSGTRVSEAAGAPPGSDAGAGDDTGDGDGPRRPSRFLHHSFPRSYPRAAQRSLIPKPLTRRAFAWLLTLALLLAYLALPGFAALFVHLGQPALASEVLRYKPVLLLPVPPGWSKSD